MIVRVQSLVDAVDHLHTSTNSNVPLQLIKDLRAAIQFRKRVALGYKQGDEGHAYFLTFLQYCLQVLVAVKEAARQKQAGKHGDILEKLVERSNANQEEEIEDEILDEAGDESEPIYHPAEPADTAFTISQDLIKGTDCYQVAVFLKTIDSFMGSIVQNYQTIKQNCRVLFWILSGRQQ